MPWTLKYQPTKLVDIVGNEQAKKDLVTFLDRSATGKGIILEGPTGTGKTAAVIAAAKERGFELVELNASDARNEAGISAIAGIAAGQRSLFASSKIILIDEVDAVSGTYDRGGVGAIVELIESSSFPVVLTANDVSESKFSALRKKAKVIKWESPSAAEVKTILQRIALAEGIKLEEHALSRLANSVGGDIRAGITDLEVLAAVDKQITLLEVESLGERLPQESIKNALTRIFRGHDPKVAWEALDRIGEDLDETLMWVEENLPVEYKDPADLDRAFDALSMADIFRSRIRRMQHWRFLFYVSALISAGVSVAKDAKLQGPINYKRPERILRMWIANQRNASKKAIAQILAPHLHLSTKEAMANMPMLLALSRQDPSFVGKLKDRYKIEDEKLAYFAK